MTTELKPIRTKADYKAALAEVERLWGAKSGTPKGDRLDVLATLIDAYEARHYPMDPPDPIEANPQLSLNTRVIDTGWSADIAPVREKGCLKFLYVTSTSSELAEA